MSNDNFEERIVEAARTTRRVGKIDDYNLLLQASNKGCGDSVVMYLLLDQERKIADIRFEAKGCILSRASVSIACDAVFGLGIEKALWCAQSLIASAATGEFAMGECSNIGFEDAHGLIESVRYIPLRVECALLPWRAFIEHPLVQTDAGIKFDAGS
jgi:nitrogen fixation NifU-like protein